MNDITYVGKHLRTYSVLKHRHDSWEIVYCTSGNGKFTFSDDSCLEYDAGDIVIIPQGEFHKNESARGFTNIHVNISNATFPFKQALLIADDSEKHILNAFADAFYYYNNEINKKPLIMSALGNLIVNFIIAFQSTKPLTRVVEEIKSDIVKNFPDCNYELDKYLKSFPFSYDYLRKLFKSEMGITPHSYLTAMRMQTAEKLLCAMDGEEYNVTRIAQMCGFDEPLYFSRVFKKQYGCSPYNYAKHKLQNKPEQ
ncbi:MAG: helix-turn-helix domain-containing protein [Corallococcus sp.]|nr:helix-turn-helix domain-containing protein [Corallococcus sp.]